VLVVVAVAAVECMPQAVVGGAPPSPAAVGQPPFIPGPGTIPSQLVQFTAPVAPGAPPIQPQFFSLTPVVLHQMSEAEQNALAHREFLKVWEAQATRNLVQPTPAPAAAPVPAALAAAPAKDAPVAAPLSAEPAAEAIPPSPAEVPVAPSAPTSFLPPGFSFVQFPTVV